MWIWRWTWAWKSPADGGEPFAQRIRRFPRTPACGPHRPRHPRDHQRDTDRPHIQTLKAIGLNAVNLSSTRSTGMKFEQITGRDLFGKVREKHMDALPRRGIPFKLNAVAMRGFNDDELPAFVDYAMHHPIDVRFIEFMPMGEGTRWSDSCFWSAPDILDAVKGSSPSSPWSRSSAMEAPARSIRFQARTAPASGASADLSAFQPFLHVL